MAWQQLLLLAKLMALTTRTGGESEGTSECTFLTPPPAFFFFRPFNKIHLITLDFFIHSFAYRLVQTHFHCVICDCEAICAGTAVPHLHCPMICPYKRAGSLNVLRAAKQPWRLLVSHRRPRLCIIHFCTCNPHTVYRLWTNLMLKRTSFAVKQHFSSKFLHNPALCCQITLQCSSNSGGDMYRMLECTENCAEMLIWRSQSFCKQLISCTYYKGAILHWNREFRWLRAWN